MVSLFTGSVNIISFSFCLWLNHLRRYLAAKHYLMIFGIGIVTYVNTLMPPASYGPMNFIPMVIIPSMIFKDKKWMYIYLFFTLIGFLASWYYITQLAYFSQYSNTAWEAGAIINIIVNIFVVTFLSLLFYRGLQEEYELAILQKNQLLEEQNLQIKQAQTQLVQAEKMASLGQLTAGIAHEINNPINFVSGNVSPMKRDIQEIDQWIVKNCQGVRPEEIQETFEEVYELLAGIEEGAGRTKDIVKGLRNFSRLDEDDKKVTDVHQGIESTLTLLTHRIPSTLHIHKQYGDLPAISCYPGKLNQVFMNILTNALDATGEEGEIFIQTNWKGEDKQLINVSFRDTGIGMTPYEREHLFDPFFTTKEVGKGTGLGMSIAYGIIQQHQGSIEVKSEKGKGSEFIISLPVE